MASAMCSRCGRQADGEEPHGLCPSCLLRENAFGETGDLPDRQCSGCEASLPADSRFCALCGTPAPASPAASHDPLRLALVGKLGAQYRVLRLLGRGGMGAVYLARDLTLEREVAIKIVTPAVDRDRMYERFRREAKTAAKLSHPNIVPLHAFGEVEGMPYFVMGYVRGESLADRLRRDGRLAEDEARRILVEIADALDHAHSQGVVHRDVKPANVLLEDASGRALLTDFGIAKTINHGETLTQHGTVVGTPHYMSPEQAAGRGDTDGRSDIYSLGVMAYAMLAGRLPFEGPSVANILAGHLTQEPPSLRSLVPTLSDSTIQAVERCMAKDPAKRWQDSRALKATLGTLEEAKLPDALESVQGHGLPYIAISALLLLAAWFIVIRKDDGPIGVLGLIAGTIVAGYALIVARLRFEGFPLALTQRVIWSEPGWWPYWYPRALRRPGNVWDQLPPSVRLNRSFIPFMFLAFVLPTIDATENIVEKVSGVAIVVVIGIVLEIRTKLDLKKRGIASGNDLNRIATSTPPSRTTFWSQPRIATILSAPRQGKAPLRPDSPHDQLQSILRVAAELSGPLRPLGAEAATAARRLIESIAQSDKEIADLARSLEPGEEQRLAEKIEALANITDSGPMRALIEKQLELIRDLSARIELARDRRNRHIEMLKTLALHLSSLRARMAETPSEVRSVSDHVRALCEHIGQQAVASSAENQPTVEQAR